MFDGIDAGSWGEIIVGVVAIIVGVFVVVRWQVEKRKIAYQIRTNSIIRVDGVHSDEIEIKFKGTEVRTLTLFSIAFKNLGNRPILKADWEKPIEISFNSKEAKILDIKTVSSYPSGLEVSTFTCQSDDGVVASVAPLLLNAKEGFKLQFVISEFNDAKIKARIVGISDLTVLDEDTSPNSFFLSNSLDILLQITITALAFIFYKFTRTELSTYDLDFIYFILVLIPVIFSALFFMRRNSQQKLDVNFLEK